MEIEKGKLKMKNRKKYLKIYKIISQCFLMTAVFSAYYKNPHCLIILHQPDVPVELKVKSNLEKKC